MILPESCCVCEEYNRKDPLTGEIRIGRWCMAGNSTNQDLIYCNQHKPREIQHLLNFSPSGWRFDTFTHAIPFDSF